MGSRPKDTKESSGAIVSSIGDKLPLDLSQPTERIGEQLGRAIAPMIEDAAREERVAVLDDNLVFTGVRQPARWIFLDGTPVERVKGDE